MKLYEIYFSPTGGTKKVADAVAAALNGRAEQIDLIKTPDRLKKIKFQTEDVCLVAVPSYGGRVPAPAAECLKKAQGNGAKAVLAAVYGNRHIDDTLAELFDVLCDAGFECAAALEAVAQHSLMPCYGKGRPDGRDREQLQTFAAQIREALADPKRCAGLKERLPGNRPYKEFHNKLPLKPEASRKCEGCGLCAAQCPAGAIPKENPRLTDKEKCISCMHCVAACPKKARKVSAAVRLAASYKMRKVCSGRKENRLYL